MTPKAAESSGLNSWRAAIAAAALLAYAATLGARGWVRDDRWLIADNALFRAGLSAAPAVLRAGYVEAARGASTPIEEYRPLLSLSFLVQRAISGRRPGPFHAVNVLLHAAVCLLLFSALRRYLDRDAAGAASLIFAIMPVHAEAVSYLTSRSELLVAASALGCWLLLGAARERPRLAAGLACFAAGLLSKEHALVIPAFLALSDWVFEGRRPWEASRRRVYAGLALVALAALAARTAVIGLKISGGVPFFASRLDAALGWPGFALRHYAWPAASGLGLCVDFTRAGSRLVVTSSVPGWLGLAVLLVAAGACAIGVVKRRRWAFWALGPFLFLLPTCPLIVPLDTLGAERFLYIPTIGWAAALGWGFHRLGRSRPMIAWASLATLSLWYAGLLIARNRVWFSDRAFYEAACACNPSSARARASLGAALLMEGDEAGGKRHLEEAQRLDPTAAEAPYNLAQLAWRHGNAAAAAALARRAVSLDDGSSDAWVLLGLAEDALGRRDEAAGDLRRALALMPWNALAHFNLGRLLLLQGRSAEGAAHLRRFAQLAPDDPDAPRIAALLENKP